MTEDVSDWCTELTLSLNSLTLAGWAKCVFQLIRSVEYSEHSALVCYSSVHLPQMRLAL